MNGNDAENTLRRRLILGAAAAAMVAPFGALAQGISRRPVRLLLAQTPGTTPDVIARLLAPRLQEHWDQPFVVENRAGASGAIGMEAVAKAAPDGHTMMVNVATTLTLPFFYANLPFDVLKSFQPITLIGSNNFALVVHGSVAVTDLKEFIAYAKVRPGRLNYASPGNGTHHHLCMELLKLKAGIDLVHIPYKGSAGATNDLLAGHIGVMFLPIHQALGMAKDGRVRVLGGTRRDRHPLFPDLPSLHEQGVEDFDVDPWYAFWGPAGLPADIVSNYGATLRKILGEPAMRAALNRQGLLVRPTSPGELAKIAQAEYDMWAQVVRAANIRPD